MYLFRRLEHLRGSEWGEKLTPDIPPFQPLIQLDQATALQLFQSNTSPGCVPPRFFELQVSRSTFHALYSTMAESQSNVEHLEQPYFSKFEISQPSGKNILSFTVKVVHHADNHELEMDYDSCLSQFSYVMECLNICWTSTEAIVPW